MASLEQPVGGRSWMSGVTGSVGQVCNSTASAVTGALFAPLAILASGTMRRVFLAMALLNIPLQIAVHFWYREEVGNLGSLGGLNISIMTIALAGLYSSGLLRRIASGAPRTRTQIRTRVSIPLAAYLLITVFSILVAQDIALALFDVFALLEAFLFYVYIANSVNSREDLLFILRFLLAGLLLQGLLMTALGVGVIGDVSMPGFRLRVDSNKELYDFDRVGGSVGSPNDAADYMAVGLAVAFSVLLATVGRKYRNLALLSLGIGVPALAFTFSRGAWISCLLSLAILTLAGIYRKQISLRTLIIAAAPVVLVVIVLSGPITERLFADDAGSADSRVPLMRMAGLMIADHPLMGVGVNNFPLAMEPYVSRGFAGEFVYAVHNKYLLIWAETGIAGLIAFVWFLIATIRKGYQCWKRRDPFYGPLALGCAAALAGHMVHLLVEFLRGHPTTQMMVLLAALIAASDQLTHNRQQLLSRSN